MRKWKRTLEAAMTMMILAGSFYIGKYSAGLVKTAKAVKMIQSENVSEEVNEDINEEMTEEAIQNVFENKRIVIDCGHGGFDSGKVGINGVLEKDVNLAIGEKVCALLEEQGAQVIMTREDEGGLYDEEEENKKQQDMKRRVQLINESNADFAVSIHQNSYTEEYVKGPQVFYYETSEKAKTLAEVLQKNLNERLFVERPREIRANTTYYILCKTEIPTVIVECGFLSNQEEADKLADPDYQQQIAEAICCGMEEYYSDISSAN